MMKKIMMMAVICCISLFHSLGALAASSGIGDFQYIFQEHSAYNLLMGKSKTLKIFAHADEGDFDVTPRVIFSIKDPSIVKLEQGNMEATIVPLKVGQTDIHVTFEGLTTDISVTVYEAGTIDVNDVYKNMNLQDLAAARQASLAIVNETRTAVGITPLKLDEKLNKAAQAHSNYLQWNGYEYGHNEDVTQPGSTGIGPYERIRYVGYGNFPATGEVISFKGDSEEDTQDLIDAPLHRTILLSPSFEDVGIGFNKNENTVINTGADVTPHSTNTRVYYPYDGQVEVPAAWFAAEDPNPLEPFGRAGETVGYPISINADVWTQLLVKNASITDSAGNPIEFYTLDDQVYEMASGNIYLIPKEPLTSGTTYTVKVSYSAKNFDTEITTNESHSWSFTTKAFEVTDLTASQSVLSAQIGESVEIGQFIATYLSGKEEDVTDKVTFHYDSDLLEIKDGYVTVKKGTDDYIYVEVEYEGVSTMMAVSVWEPTTSLFLEVDSVTAQDTTITGESLANTDISVLVGDSVIAAGATDANGRFSIPIPKQQTGTEVTVIAEDEDGNQYTYIFSVEEVEEELPVSTIPFQDVSSRYHDAVLFVYSKGVSGMSTTTFGTAANIKRVDAAVMLVKVLGLDTESVRASGFTDVPERAVKYVNALKAANITSGKTATTFDSQSEITRGELAIWIQRAFKLEGNTSELAFTDVADRYQSAVSALVQNGITTGITSTTFGTHNNAKRGDFAIFLLRSQ